MIFSNKKYLEKNYEELKAIVLEREKEEIKRLAFEAQFKPKAKNLTFVFRDSKGNEYFEHVNKDDVGLARRAKIMECVQELYMGGPIKEVIEGYRKQFQEEADKGNSVAALLAAQMLFNEIDVRTDDYFMDAGSYFRLMAAGYIRQDEDPYEFDLELWHEKADQFKADLVERDAVFFSPLLTEYLGISPVNKSEWGEFLTASMAKEVEIQNLRELLLSQGRSSTLANANAKA